MNLKKNLISFVTAIILLLPFSSTLHATERLTLDNQHTFVLWYIKHLGFSTQTGKWYVDGFIDLDKDHPENSKVNATIKIANLVTGIPESDKHLKSELFFNAGKFPTATFVSNKIDILSKTTAKIHGVLTLRGVSKPVTLDVTLNKVGKNPIHDRMTVGFTATTEIKRSDFGMTAFLPDLSDDVKIDIEAEAYQAQPGQKDATQKQ